MVASRVKTELHSWIDAVYVADNTSAPLHTSRNKGREANAYLSFIIENYNELPDISVFIHGHRRGYPTAWHTDALDYDIVNTLHALNVTYVQQEGYANLRCNLNPGCSKVIEPYKQASAFGPLTRDDTAEVVWLEVWKDLFVDISDEAPLQIGSPCCAQFAASRDSILRRPHHDYVKYHRWLMSTPLSDEISGRVMEYAWHMMFGKSPVQ